MTKDDFIRKITSRKFWVAIAGFITGLIVYMDAEVKSAEALGGLILSFGSVVSYILGEGWADAGSTTHIHVTGDELKELENHPPDNIDE